MRIQCDSCNSAAASLFCSADEAALCPACDHRTHHENKLTMRHHRYTFLKEPTSPLCDICQDRRAFFFCKQDRALLCRDCDTRIHNANRYTQNHTRLLLTGIRVSSQPTIKVSDYEDDSAYSVVPENLSSGVTDSGTSIPGSRSGFPPGVELGDSGPTTAKISDYLMEMLPGWRVDDFLDSPCYDDNTPSNSFKNEKDGSYLSERSGVEASANFGIWVSQPLPQAPAEVPQQWDKVPQQWNKVPQQWDSLQTSGGRFGDDTQNLSSAPMENTAWWTDDAFTVPEISRAGSKRFRQF